GPQSPPNRGAGNVLTIHPKEVLRTAKRNLNKCAAELPDFRALLARLAWMTPQTIAIPHEVVPIAVVSV
ncbi:MAG: hypothetical protein ACREUM_03340, partial [Nitrosospira sp.]